MNKVNIINVSLPDIEGCRKDEVIRLSDLIIAVIGSGESSVMEIKQALSVIFAVTAAGSSKNLPLSQRPMWITSFIAEVAGNALEHAHKKSVQDDTLRASEVSQTPITVARA